MLGRTRAASRGGASDVLQWLRKNCASTAKAGRRFRAPQAGIIMAAQKPENQGRQPISPAKRRMLQQWYESASKASASGNWDYATENLTNCVVEDPANRMYVQSFLGNLQKKFNNDKKGSKLAGIKGAGTKGS